MTAPTLVLAWGNPSRGDDALGPRCLDLLEQLATRHPEWGAIEFLTDFQLQVEHALDLENRERVLFIDASADLESDVQLREIAPRTDATFSSHSLSPEAVLQVFADLHDEAPPPSTLLAVRGQHFELGSDLSPAAMASLHLALEAAVKWIERAPTACRPG